MTVQPPESSTYSNYSAFPSEPENPFRAIKGDVFTTVQEYFTEVDASFQIGFAGNLTSVRIAVTVNTDDAGNVTGDEDKVEIATARADLDFMNQHWTEFYAAAVAALEEIPVV